MSPVKDFSLTYDEPSEEGTFSEGDFVTGSVTFSLTKETKIKSLFVKAKGEGRVSWTDGSGDPNSSYSAERRYFKVKEFLIAESAKGTVLGQGDHSFTFRIEIPNKDMPSSFKDAHARVVYLIEAKLCKSWQWPSKAKTEICFLSKSLPRIGDVTIPQSDSVTKELGTFSKEQVELSANVDKKVCSPGDTVTASAIVCNSSSKSMKPKFVLQQRTMYRAGSHTKTCEDRIVQVVGDAIAANSEKTASCEVTVPEDATCTVHNCDVVSVEYSIKVSLDISFAFDPELVFPLVVAPPALLAATQAEQVDGDTQAGIDVPADIDVAAGIDVPADIDVSADIDAPVDIDLPAYATVPEGEGPAATDSVAAENTE